MTDVPDLWALPPEAFTAARDAAAKKDPALKALRRPTMSAWVVNRLVRSEPDLVEQLLRLGAELAAAQDRRDAPALRALSEQRRHLVQAAVHRAAALVDRQVSATAREEVAATLEAAVADPGSAQAVRSGRLVRPLSYAGFGPVDLVDAVADLPAPVGRGAAPARKGRSAAQRPAAGRPAAAAGDAAQGPGARATADRLRLLEQAALEAAGALDDAVRVAGRAAAQVQQTGREVEQSEAAALEMGGSVTATEQAVAAAREQLSTARRQLAAAEQELAVTQQQLVATRQAAGEVSARRTEAGRAARVAAATERKAQAAVGTAQRAADEARAALDRGRRS